MADNERTISVMIPCYNEEENVLAIYGAVKEQLMTLPYNYEILFIDNKSSDNTRNIIRTICAKDRKVKAIFNVKNFGQFNSPYYGIINTSGDCTIAMCADFQDPVEMIPKFVHAWEEGYKIVIGRKTRSQENPFIFWLRGCYYKIIKKMSSTEQIEQFTGFGLYDKSFINTLRDLKDPTPFIRGIVAEMGPERKEIEYEQPQRRAGKTHNNWYTLYDAAMLSFTSYTKNGLRVATFAGFIISLCSIFIGLIIFVMKLCFWDKFTAGYAPMMIGIFFMGGLILAFLGFMGEYVMAINARVINRPLVVEEERINFQNHNIVLQESKLEERKSYIDKIYQAHYIINDGGTIDYIIEKTELSRSETEYIFTKEKEGIASD